MMDKQDKVLVIVNQGESVDPEKNLKLGEFWIEGLGKYPAGNQIIVRFQIDLSGLLTVTATEKSTGLAKSVTIDTAGQHRINLDTARDNLAALFDEYDSVNPALSAFEPDESDQDDVIEIHATESSANLIASAKSLRGRAKNLLDCGVAETDAETIRTKLEGIPTLIESRDWETLQDELDNLSDLLFYLED